MTNIAPAVILSHGSGGLGAIRSLARRGVIVTAVLFANTDLAKYSRYAAQVFSATGREDFEREASVLEILRSLPSEGAAILTTSDRGVTLLSNHRDELCRKFHFALPPPDQIDALNDKSREVELISSLGFAVPKSVSQLPRDALTLSQELRFPIIFKPRSFAERGLFPEKNEVVYDLANLSRFYADWSHALHGMMAQEVIPGPVSYSWVCSCTYNENSEMLDCMTRQKFRTIPPEFGVSTYSECRDNPAVLELARELGKRLGYVGHAGIEFRWDNRNNEYKYIELNPRIPGEVGFDQACGLPTVWNSYLVALGRENTCSGRAQKQGLAYHDMRRDILTMRAERKPVNEILRTQLAMLFRRTSGRYFAWDDIKPGVVELTRFLRHLFRWSLQG